MPMDIRWLELGASGDTSGTARAKVNYNFEQLMAWMATLPNEGVVSWSTLPGAPTLAAVATSGSYADLSNKPSIPTILARSFNNTPGRSLVSAAAAANGFQVSSTRDALVNYSVTISTAVQIGVTTNVDGYVVLEVAATNSATASDWTEIGRSPQAQNIGLAVALSSTQKGGGQVGGTVQAGWYARLRTVNTTGTPVFTYNSGQEVLL